MPDLGHSCVRYLKTDVSVGSEQTFPWHRQSCPIPGSGEMEFVLRDTWDRKASLLTLERPSFHGVIISIHPNCKQLAICGQITAVW